MIKTISSFFCDGCGREMDIKVAKEYNGNYIFKNYNSSCYLGISKRKEMQVNWSSEELYCYECKIKHIEEILRRLRTYENNVL